MKDWLVPMIVFAGCGLLAVHAHYAEHRRKFPGIPFTNSDWLFGIFLCLGMWPLVIAEAPQDRWERKAILLLVGVLIGYWIARPWIFR
ncbi:MAG: hypothetical protein ACHQ4J_02940 [Candidatus Binatia bacterium]